MSSPTEPGRPRGHLRVSLSVLATAIGAATLYGASTFAIGRASERTFLKNYRPPFEMEARLSYMMDYVRNSDEANDVLFLGGSGCHMGVDANLFERETGLRAFNLGTWGVLGPDGFLAIFRDYLEHHPRPKVLVYCLDLKADPTFSNESDARIYKRFNCDYFQDQGARPCPGESPLHYVREGTWVASGWLQGGRRRYFLEEMSTAWHKGQNYVTYGRRMREQRGHYIPPEPETRNVVKLPGVPFTEIPDYLDKIRALAREAREAGISVVFQVSPIRDDFAFADPRFDMARVEASVQEWTRSLERDFPNVTVARPELLRYDPSECWDSYHPNRKGAEILTLHLAERVTRTLADRAIGDAGEARVIDPEAAGGDGRSGSSRSDTGPSRR